MKTTKNIKDEAREWLINTQKDLAFEKESDPSANGNDTIQILEGPQTIYEEVFHEDLTMEQLKERYTVLLAIENRTNFEEGRKRAYETTIDWLKFVNSERYATQTMKGRRDALRSGRLKEMMPLYKIATETEDLQEVRAIVEDLFFVLEEVQSENTNLKQLIKNTVSNLQSNLEMKE